MSVKVGDAIPEATMNIMGDKGPEEITTTDIFSGKKVVLFAVPGAFTPTCSAAHLPGIGRRRGGDRRWRRRKDAGVPLSNVGTGECHTAKSRALRKCCS